MLSRRVALTSEGTSLKPEFTRTKRHREFLIDASHFAVVESAGGEHEVASCIGCQIRRQN